MPSSPAMPSAAPAMLAAVAADSCTPFKVFWTEAVYPKIKDDLERLSRTAPKRMTKKAVAKGAEAHDQVCAKLMRVMKEAQSEGERRNAYMNLAWTGPVDNSFLQEKISLGKVENMAADMFLRSLPTDAAVETALKRLGARRRQVQVIWEWTPW